MSGSIANDGFRALVRPLPAEGCRLLAEVAGTFGLVFFGAGAATVDFATDGSLGRVGIGLTFGLAVMAMVLAFGRISGAHINPAVTVGLWAAGEFPARRIPGYVLAQLVGALIAAATLHGLFRNTGGELGSTAPAGTWEQSFGLELVLTFLLMYGILAVAHQRGPDQKRASLPMVAVVAGAIVGLEATFAGGISGASMNPARSFGPGAIAWFWDHHWIYWVAPVLGALLAAILHLLLRAGISDDTAPLDDARLDETRLERSGPGRGRDAG